MIPNNITEISWKGFPTSSYSACGSLVGFLGGPKLFQKDAYAILSFDNVPPHLILRIRLRFIRIDDWANRTAFIHLNKKEIFSRTFGNQEGLLTENHCGESSLDSSYMFIAETNNQLRSFTIKISSDIDNLGSWGISEYFILISNRTTRTDQVSTILKTNDFEKGNWTDAFCPENSWVRSASALISFKEGLEENEGIFYVYFDCYSATGEFITQLNSSSSNYDDMGSNTRISKVFCPNDPQNFFFGFKNRTEDMTGVFFECSDRQTILELIPSQALAGNESYWAYCPEGSAICGRRYRFSPFRGELYSDNRTNNMNIHCCKL